MTEDTTDVSTSRFAKVDTKSLVMVEYPGYINNVDRMLKTLGGAKSLSKVFYEKKCRLQMTYRPEDPDAHYQCADPSPCTGVLVKVRRHKSTGKCEQEICGIVSQVYRFQSLMDYQYLTPEPLWDALKNIHGSELATKREPLHLPPPVFARIDNRGSYSYRPDPVLIRNPKESADFPPENERNVGGLARKRRQTESQAALFETEGVVMKPSEQAVIYHNRMLQGSDEAAIKVVQRLFEERPVWSKSAILSHVSVGPERIKRILPYFSFYWLSGPWRALWCRMGYDPRELPEAKVYQLMEIRMRDPSTRLPLYTRRSASNYIPRNLQARTCAHASSVTISAKDERKERNHSYVFSEAGPMPTRNMYYQLCDIHVASVQSLIHVNDGNEPDICSEKSGWLEASTLTKIRSTVSDMIVRRLQEEDRKTAEDESLNLPCSNSQ